MMSQSTRMLSLLMLSVLGIIALLASNLVVQVATSTGVEQATQCVAPHLRALNDLFPTLYLIGTVVMIVGPLFLMIKLNGNPGGGALAGLALLIAGLTLFAPAPTNVVHAASTDCLLVGGSRAMEADLNHGGFDATGLGAIAWNADGVGDIGTTSVRVATIYADALDASLAAATGLPVAGLANGTDGQLITWDSSGIATTVAVGTSTQVLTSNGAGAAPTFQAAGGGGASTALDNLASVQINTTLLSDTADTDDLGTDAAPWRTAYLGTSLVFDQTTRNVTIVASEPASSARTYTIPDFGANDSFVGLAATQTLTNKTFVTPALGTPASGVVTNLTGTASININGTVGAGSPTTGVFTTADATTDFTVGTLVLTDDTVTFGAKGDINLPAASGAALQIRDGTSTYLEIDTRLTTDTDGFTWDVPSITIPSHATEIYRFMVFDQHDINYTGNTQVTARVDNIFMRGPRVSSNTGGFIVDETSTLTLGSANDLTNTVITMATALHITDNEGTPAGGQVGIFIEALVGSATFDRGIQFGGAQTDGNIFGEADLYFYTVAGSAIHLGDSTDVLVINGDNTLTCPTACNYSSQPLLISAVSQDASPGTTIDGEIRLWHDSDAGGVDGRILFRVGVTTYQVNADAGLFFENRPARKAADIAFFLVANNAYKTQTTEGIRATYDAFFAEHPTLNQPPVFVTGWTLNFYNSIVLGYENAQAQINAQNLTATVPRLRPVADFIADLPYPDTGAYHLADEETNETLSALGGAQIVTGDAVVLHVDRSTVEGGIVTGIHVAPSRLIDELRALRSGYIRPSCDAEYRGDTWTLFDDDTGDSFAVCLKAAGGAYAWAVK